MQSIKTVFIVIMLLAVLYGVHTVMTQPDVKPPRGAAEAARQLPTDLEFDEGSIEGSPDVGTMSDNTPPNRDLAMAENTRPLIPPPRSTDRNELAADGKFTPARSPRSTPPTDENPPLPAPHSRNFENPLTAVTLPRVPDLVDQSNVQLEPPPTEPLGGAFGGATGTEFRPSDRNGVEPAAEPEGAGPGVPAAPAAADSERFPTTPLLVAPPLGAALNSALNSAPLAAPAKEFVEGVRFDPKDAVLDRGWRTAQDSIKQGQWRPALGTLSALYADPRLSHDERQRLLETLDPLAGRVIYSTEHLLEPPHEVRRGDTLMSIAERLNIPWQLLRNINGVANPEYPVPGTKLKVVRGPFRAEVDLASQEVTVYLQRLYAGRFPISVGNEPAPRSGDYEIQHKDGGRQYSAPNGVVLPAGDPLNPYGRCWLDLGSELSIHGAALEAGGPVTTGCIGLSPKDADDVFAILSPGSRVSIR